ncbi:MAG: riboflavin synthase subunit alpha [Candidatus Poseidoniales archaeon]|jgi:riboflavin synthase|tara:strand:- start:314 stop:937 length:624 start_codon:yes stop_codon:yes gene_type:complete
MFTGIVQGIGIIVSINKKISVNNISIEMGKISNNLQNGASVSINGVCLTVANIIDSTVTFDAIQETLKRSTLGSLKRGDEVNLERALKFGDELGGHLLSGHIMSTAIVADYEKIGQSVDMKISINDKLSPFIIEKGYIAIDGISLTIGEVFPEYFSLHLIPETLERTTIVSKVKGRIVNIEIDSMTQAVVATVSKMMKQSDSINLER